MSKVSELAMFDSVEYGSKLTNGTRVFTVVNATEHPYDSKRKHMIFATLDGKNDVGLSVWEWMELGYVPVDYIRADLVQRQIEEAVKDRWLALRNKIIDELQDQITDDQLQVVLQIIDDEQWFPAIAEAIRNGEEVEK